MEERIKVWANRQLRTVSASHDKLQFNEGQRGGKGAGGGEKTKREGERIFKGNNPSPLDH